MAHCACTLHAARSAARLGVPFSDATGWDPPGLPFAGERLPAAVCNRSTSAPIHPAHSLRQHTAMLGQPRLQHRLSARDVRSPASQIPFTVVFTKLDKRKKGGPPAEENIAAFEAQVRALRHALKGWRGDERPLLVRRRTRGLLTSWESGVFSLADRQAARMALAFLGGGCPFAQPDDSGAFTVQTGSPAVPCPSQLGTAVLRSSEGRPLCCMWPITSCSCGRRRRAVAAQPCPWCMLFSALTPSLTCGAHDCPGRWRRRAATSRPPSSRRPRTAGVATSSWRTWHSCANSTTSSITACEHHGARPSCPAAAAPRVPARLPVVRGWR